MNAEERQALRRLVDARARDRVERGYMDCDPESLTKRAADADEAGYPEIGEAVRAFRDKVVNPLLGEGWTVARIEEAAIAHFGRER